MNFLRSKLRNQGMYTFLFLLLSLFITPSIALAAESPKYLAFEVKDSSGSVPSGTVTVDVTDSDGNTESAATSNNVTYDSGAGSLQVTVANFAGEWAESQVWTVLITVGTAGQSGYEALSLSVTLDAETVQSFDGANAVSTAKPGFTLVSGGTNLTGLAGDSVGSITVKATDPFGAVESGVAVTTSAGSTHITGTAPTATTDSSGEATVSWTLGTAIGTQTLTISAPARDDITINATASANPAQVTNIVKVSGDAPTDGVAGSVLTNPFVIQATNGTDGIEGVAVAFAVASGGGSISTETVNTDPSGNAETTLTLGQTAGSNSVTVSIAGSSASDATFTADGAAGPATKLAVAVSSDTISSNSATDVTVTATLQDQYGNTATTDTSDITFTADADTYAAFSSSTTTTSTAVAGIASATLTSTVSGGGAAVVTVSSGSLTTAQATVTTVPFSLNITDASLEVGGTQALTLTGGSSSSTYAVSPTTATLSSESASGVTFTAPTTITADSGSSYQTFTVTASDTIGSGSVTSTTTILVFDTLALTSGGSAISGTLSGTSGGTTTVAVAGGEDATYAVSVAAPTGVTGGTCGTDTTICSISSGTITFTAPSTGNFAGTYTFTVSSDLGNSESSSTTFSVSVPMTISVGATHIPEATLTGDSAVTAEVTVSGAGDGDTITFTVMDSSGADDTAGAIATIADATAGSDGIAMGTIVPADVTDFSAFTVSAANSTQSALATVQDPDESYILPVTTYSGFIKDNPADSTTAVLLSGATVTVDNYTSQSGTIVSATTDSTGEFTFTLPTLAGSKHYNFTAAADGYVANAFAGTNYVADAAATDVSLDTAGITVSGSIDTSLSDGLSADIYALDSSGTVLAGPITVVGSGGAGASFQISTGTNVTSVASLNIVSNGFKSKTVTESSEWTADTTIASSITLEASVDFSVSEDTTTGVALTFSGINMVTDAAVDISTYTATAIDSSGTAVADPTASTSSNSAVASFATDQDMTVFLKDGNDDVVFVYDYLAATAGSAGETYKNAIDVGQVTGTQQLEVVGNDISGTKILFDQDASDQTVTKTVTVELPPDGIDASKLASGLTIKSANLDVKTLTTTAGNSDITSSKVYEVKLDVVVEDANTDLSKVTEDIISTITITIPYDPTTITDPDKLTDGTYAVLQADSFAKFLTGTYSKVISGSDLTVDTLNNTVSFSTTHLSTFGIDETPTTTSSVSGGGGGFGPWMLLLLAPLAVFIRRKRS